MTRVTQAHEGEEVSPEGRALLSMIQSPEAAEAIDAAHVCTAIYRAIKGEPHQFYKHAVAIAAAQVRYEQALHTLQAAYPEAGDFTADSWSMVRWTIQCAGNGFEIPAATAAARRLKLPDPAEYARHKCIK